MKKICCALALAVTLCVGQTAGAITAQAVYKDIDTSWVNPGTQTTTGGINKTEYEYKKACEVCPYADQSLCAGWVPDCPDETIKLNPDLPVVTPDLPVIGPVVTTATVSSCPSGTTKSSDGCCCINN